MAFTKRFVTATFPQTASGGAVGVVSTVDFTLSAPLYNTTTGEVLEMTQTAPVDPITGAMGWWDAGQSAVGIWLACNDAPDVTPSGTVYYVAPHLAGPVLPGTTFSIQVLIANTSPLALASAARPTGGSVTYGINTLTSQDGSVTITTPSAGVRDLHVTTGGGSGTVTSVGLTMPADYAVSGSPITTSGTLAITAANQAANTVKAGPTTGAAAAPTYRSLVAADLPAATTSAQGAAILATPASDVTAGHVVQANDARLSDSRTPTGSAGGDLSGTYPNPSLSFSGALANVANLIGAVARTIVSKAGTVIGTRRQLNFIQGSNVTLTIADDSANEKVDITIAASGGSGATDPNNPFGIRDAISTNAQALYIPGHTTDTLPALLVGNAGAGYNVNAIQAYSNSQPAVVANAGGAAAAAITGTGGDIGVYAETSQSGATGTFFARRQNGPASGIGVGLFIQSSTSGTPGVGFGSSTYVQLKDTGGSPTDAAQWGTRWTNATHTSQTSEYFVQTVASAGALADRLKADGGAGAGTTGLWLYDADHSTVVRVTKGVADSGGTGFALLRVAN